MARFASDCHIWDLKWEPDMNIITAKCKYDRHTSRDTDVMNCGCGLTVIARNYAHQNHLDDSTYVPQ